MNRLFAVVLVLASQASVAQAATYYSSFTSDSPGIGPTFDADRCFERLDGPAGSVNCETSRYYENDDSTVSRVFFESFASTFEGELKTRARVIRNNFNYTTPPDGVTVNEGQAGLSANASATLRDSYTLNGGVEGTVGTLQLSFAIDGRNFTSGAVLDPAQPARGAVAQTQISIFETVESATVNQNLNISQTGTSRLYNSFLNALDDFDEVVQLELDFIYGQTLDFGISLASRATIFEVSQRTSAVSATTNFASTARLVGIDALDAGGAQIETLSLISESGSSVVSNLVAERNQLVASGGTGGGMTPVPLPGSGGLALLVAGAFAGLSRRRQHPRKG